MNKYKNQIIVPPKLEGLFRFFNYHYLSFFNFKRKMKIEKMIEYGKVDKIVENPFLGSY